MNIENPYATPKSLGLEIETGGCRREGKNVFVPSGQDLPPRCIVCNRKVHTPAKRRVMYWHSPWLYLLVLPSLLIYAVVALIVRKKTRVSPAYCETHSAARRMKFGILSAPSVIFVIAGAFLLVVEDASSAAIAFVLAILFLVIAIIATKTVRPVRIDRNGATFAGCKEPFLSSL